MVSKGSVAVPSLKSNRACAPETSTPICDKRGNSLRLMVTVLDAKSMRVSDSVSVLDADTDEVDDDDVLGSVDGYGDGGGGSEGGVKSRGAASICGCGRGARWRGDSGR